MERRTLLFVMLSLTIWYGWMLAFPPPTPVVNPANPTVAGGPAIADPANQVEPVTPAEPVEAVQGPERRESFEKCDAHATWSNRGGGLSNITLDGYHSSFVVTPFYSWALGGFGPWEPYAVSDLPAMIVGEHGSAFAVGAGDLLQPPVNLAPAKGPGDLAGGSGSVGSIAIHQELAPSTDADKPCTFVLTTTWTNTGSSAFEGPLWVAAHDGLPEGGGGMMSRYQNQSSSVGLVDGGAWTLSDYPDLTGPTLVDEGPVGYFGIMDRYFAALAVPSSPHGELFQTRVKRGDIVLDGTHFVAARGLDAGATHTEVLTLYVGEKNLEHLTAVHPDLGNAVELGWFGFFARMLLWMLKLFHAAVGNWGLAIILLTVTVKVVFFPLTHSAFKSGQAMQAIQPMLAELKETYKDNQDELNKRTIELFRENKVNPVGGCLPMVIQIPVFIALYNVLLSSVELYQTDFLYLQDLSSQDPYGILPVIVMGLFVLQQQFTPMANMDPLQARMMKLMPIVFGLFFFTFPAGLVIYIFVNTTLSVLQQWYIRRNFSTAPKTVEAGT